jgi:thymidylate synthase (FAD)
METRDMFAGPLGDSISSVELINHMGDDLMVVNAARVSMAKESQWFMTMDLGDHEPWPHLSERDEKLISYLASHGHWTPFSHPQISLRIKMPIFVARQWFKHQVGFTRNEVSRRYVDDAPELYIPTAWRKRADNVKQGSSDELIDRLTYNTTNGLQSARGEMNRSLCLYQAMIDRGVCPEQARMVLPQAMYTEFIETGSLAAYARLCALRMDPHAQKEVRLYAEEVAQIMAHLFPVSWPALTKPTYYVPVKEAA